MNHLLKIFVLLLLGVSFTQQTSIGSEVKYEKYNFRIELPEKNSWQRIESPVGNSNLNLLLVLELASFDNSQKIFITVQSAKKGHFIDDGFISNFDSSLEKQLIKRSKLSAKKIAWDGIPAYERIDVLQNHLYSQQLTRVTVDRDFIYLVTVFTKNGIDPQTDSQIQKVLSSFHFLSTPKEQYRSRDEDLATLIGSIGSKMIWFFIFLYIVLRILKKHRPSNLCTDNNSNNKKSEPPAKPETWQ